MSERMKKKATFGSAFPGALRHAVPAEKAHWHIGGSGVLGEPEDAYWTKRITEFLEASGVEVKRTYIMGMCAADMHCLNAEFLDGGLGAQTGPYFGARGASISGPRALVFVALGLGIRVPKQFLDRYGLGDVRLDDLQRELRNEPRTTSSSTNKPEVEWLASMPAADRMSRARGVVPRSNGHGGNVMHHDLLEQVRELVPTLGFQLVTPTTDDPRAAQLVECIEPTTSLRVLLGMSPGPMLICSTMLPAPPVPDADRSLIAGRLQARIPHARVHVRGIGGGGCCAFLDDAQALDPEDPVLTAAVVRRSVDALLDAARAIGLMEPTLANSDALSDKFTDDDARWQQDVRRILEENGLALIEEPHVLNGPAFVLRGDGNEMPTRLFVRGGTLCFHVAFETTERFGTLADVAMEAHQRLPFGRVLLGAADRGILVLEYAHRLGDQVAEFDVLHGFAAMHALGNVAMAVLDNVSDSIRRSEKR